MILKKRARKGKEDRTIEKQCRKRNIKQKDKPNSREMVKTKSNKQKQKQGKTHTHTHTHTKETKTEPNKIKSKRTTRKIKELKNEIKQLGLKLTKTHNLKTKPKQCAT